VRWAGPARAGLLHLLLSRARTSRLSASVERLKQVGCDVGSEISTRASQRSPLSSLAEQPQKRKNTNQVELCLFSALFVAVHTRIPVTCSGKNARPGLCSSGRPSMMG
jgi:hypothetical protein